MKYFKNESLIYFYVIISALMFLTVRRKVITGKIITRTLNFILSFEI